MAVRGGAGAVASWNAKLPPRGIFFQKDRLLLSMNLKMLQQPSSALKTPQHNPTGRWNNLRQPSITNQQALTTLATGRMGTVGVAGDRWNGFTGPWSQGEGPFLPENDSIIVFKEPPLFPTQMVCLHR